MSLDSYYSSNETYGIISEYLEKNLFVHLQWSVYVDFEIVNFLFGQQDRYAKYTWILYL